MSIRSGCSFFKALGLVHKCDNSVEIPNEEVDTAISPELGDSKDIDTDILYKNNHISKLTSQNKKYSTHLTSSNPVKLYIINNETNNMSIVGSTKILPIVKNTNSGKLALNNGVLKVKIDNSNYDIVVQASCKIDNYVRLRGDGILVGPPCGQYNKWD